MVGKKKQRLVLGTGLGFVDKVALSPSSHVFVKKLAEATICNVCILPPHLAYSSGQASIAQDNLCSDRYLCLHSSRLPKEKGRTRSIRDISHILHCQKCHIYKKNNQIIVCAIAMATASAVSHSSLNTPTHSVIGTE